MEKDINRKPILGIISDTSFYLGTDIRIFEPVLREVSAFSSLFSKIYWLGYGHNKKYPDNSTNELPNNLILIPVSPSGGSNLFEKIKTLLNLPIYFYNIISIIMKSEIIHSRGPSIPSIITIFISFIFPQKKYWHKYAGNWKMGSTTTSYRLNRFLFSLKIPGKVFVSHKSADDPNHIIQIENPCLTEKEYKENSKIGGIKFFDNDIHLCYVGRFDDGKGIHELIEVLNRNKIDKYISTFHFAGFDLDDGEISKQVKDSNLQIFFHGLINRRKLNKIYSKAHFIILPSASEGFPKVLAEAASFGCIPIIPKIDSILIHMSELNNNAIELKSTGERSILETINSLPNRKNIYLEISNNLRNYSELFTYEKFNRKIEEHFIA